jgi:hypothetical protein
LLRATQLLPLQQQSELLLQHQLCRQLPLQVLLPQQRLLLS